MARALREFATAGLMAAGLLAAPTAGRCSQNQVRLASNNGYAPRTAPVAESFTFGKHALVAVINFDPDKARKVVSIDIDLAGRRGTFPIKGDYYANWTQPVGLVDLDSGGRTVGGSFTLPVASRPGMKSPDFQIFIDLADGKFTMVVSPLA